MTVTIGNRQIGTSHPPFIIAELSGNHNQSLERALEIIELAKKANVDAIKLQTYTAETMTLNVSEGMFQINDKKSIWNGKNLYDLYHQAHTPWSWHPELFNKCRELDLLCFSTPFDASSIDFLEGLGTPAYKIASPEIIDLPLIKRAASTGKPIIMSTGMANLSDIAEAVETARNNGCKELILLKCTSAYPAKPKDANIATIPHLKKMFDVEVGISDHTLGIGVPLAAIALGASVVEKHITLKRSDGGVDAAFSLEPDEFSLLVDEAQKVYDSIGTIQYGPVQNELSAIPFRRSLYFTVDIKKGETIQRQHVRSIRPGQGLKPKYIEVVIGKKAARDIRTGEPVSWDAF